MLIDKNGKIRGKISIVDLAVILLVVIVAAGIFVRFGSKITTAAKSNEKFECVIRVNSVREYTVDALKKGGMVTDKKSEKILGEIKNVEVEPAKSQVTTAAGRIKFVNPPDRYTCYVTIEYDGKESDEGYIIGDSNELSVGRVSEIYTKYVKTSGDIMSVNVIK